MRLLILSPGHPDLGGGGAERASYSLFQWCKRDPRVSAVFYVARVDAPAIGHDAEAGCFRGRQDEIIVDLPTVDFYTFQSFHADRLRETIRKLITHLRPDVVHLHHLFGWSLETIEVFVQHGVRVVFTAHEFALICANDGQMVKTGGRLCFTSSPSECSACLPQYASGKFFVRSALFQRVLKNVSTVIVPSRFLAQRLKDWDDGLEAKVIDNLPSLALFPEQGAAPDADRSRSAKVPVVAYFGQVTPYKGVDVLLQACLLLPQSMHERIRVHIHGSNQHYLGTRLDRTIQRLRSEAPWVVWRGGYRNEDVLSLMGECDWIVVPSLWWENAPVVIQEAKAADRRLLVSELGGLVEKTDPAFDMRVPPNDPGRLADCLRAIADQAEPSMHARPSRRAALYAQAEEAFEQHLAAYGAVAAVAPSAFTDG